METATRKNKKVDKREAFTEVFERQARRFSAFDLLGIGTSPSPLSLPEPMSTREGDGKEQVREIDVGNLAQDVTGQRIISLPSHVHRTDSLGPVHVTDNSNTVGRTETFYNKDRQSEGQSDTKQAEEQVLTQLGLNTGIDGEQTSSGIHYSSVDHSTDHQAEEYRTDDQICTESPDSRAQVLGPDRPVQVNGPDGLETLGSDPSEGRTVRPKYLGRTVRPSLGQTPLYLGQTLEQEIPSLLGSDGPSGALVSDQDAILLAPLQWRVWQLLQTVTDAQSTISYRQIAKQTKSTIEGVRKAIRIIQKEGGILTKEVVRTADEQGVRLIINPHAYFRRGTLNEAKGILKRGLHLGRTPPGPTQVHGTDGLGMYVCSNLNIRQTDVVKLLRIPPLEWKVR